MMRRVAFLCLASVGAVAVLALIAIHRRGLTRPVKPVIASTPEARATLSVNDATPVSPAPTEEPRGRELSTQRPEREDAKRAAAWRSKEYGVETPDPPPLYLDAQVQYYADYLKLTADQRTRVDALVRRWWEGHWELYALVIRDRSEKESWNRIRESTRTEHRQRWDSFCSQMGSYLTEAQLERLNGNYPGQFDFAYDASGVEVSK